MIRQRIKARRLGHIGAGFGSLALIFFEKFGAEAAAATAVDV
jgi:hypothetical protein